MSYKFNLSTRTPYVNEATFLELNLTQEDHSKVMMFKFSLKKSEAYTFYQVGFKEHEKYHDLRHEYKYLIYPKKSGSISLEFELIKSLTDDDKVAYAISGDRDNVKGLVKEDIVVNVKPLILAVQELPRGTDLVGDFYLKEKLDKKVTNAFDPVNLQITLKGKGSVDTFEILKKSEHYRRFKQAPKLKVFHTKEGTSTSIEWDYAISSSNNFVLPKVTLKAFNPKSKEVYELVVPSHEIKVNEVSKSSLLDKEDSPLPSKGIDWAFWKWFFSYVFVFLAGVLMPREWFKSKVVMEKRAEDILTEKISATKSHKELLQILLLENNVQFSKAISLLEGVVYNGGKESLSKIKSQFMPKGLM
jgi:hypothetical protein